MKTQLLIMAAGIGSRFGKGIKQLTSIGPNGEIIMNYAIHDAAEAGFDEAVIVLRKDLEKDFVEKFGKSIEKDMPYKIVYQELDYLPEGFSVPEGRVKPWGTAHCILCAKEKIDSPFLVINADDYYGKKGYKLIHDFLVNVKDSTQKLDMCMAGFVIGNTLSDNGTVTRGVCEANNDNNLISVTETYEIKVDDDAVLRGEDEDGNRFELDRNSLVSMNMWGLSPNFLVNLEEDFIEFLKQRGGELKSEFLLPFEIDKKIKSGKGSVKILETPDKWYGMTYQSDIDIVIDAFKKFHEQGLY